MHDAHEGQQNHHGVGWQIGLHKDLLIIQQKQADNLTGQSFLPICSKLSFVQVLFGKVKPGVHFRFSLSDKIIFLRGPIIPPLLVAKGLNYNKTPGRPATELDFQ